MSAMARRFLAVGAALAALAVVAGALGAHALQEALAGRQSTYDTAVRYHFLHALGLMLVALFLDRLSSSRLVAAAGWSMGAGVLLFSGALYLLALTGQGWLGAVAPFGGLAYIAGWSLLAVAAVRG